MGYNRFMSVALKIEISDELAATLAAVVKSAKTTPDALIHKALERYLQAIEDQLDNDEADRVLADPEADWETLAEVKKDFGI
jgi:predicted transcriptional regulator